MYKLTELKPNFLELIVEMAYEISSNIERMSDDDLSTVMAEMESVVKHIRAEKEYRENV